MMSSEGYMEREKSPKEEKIIILVGKTGVGKSASGNTILGRREFESKLSASSQTSECQKAKGEVDGRKVAVIDTPGLFDTKLTSEEALKRVKMCISLSAPGPHVFIVVIQLGRFTEEEKETVRMIQTTFGEESAKYTMVLFTHGDKLGDQTIEKFVSTSKELQEIIRKCSGRYHTFNNRVKDPSQVIQLLDKVDKMIMFNGGRYYTNEMFMRAEEAIEQEQARLLKQTEEQKQRELDVLRVNFKGEILSRETDSLHQKYKTEARAQAERLNNTIRDAIRFGSDVGADIGGLGGPTGVKIGAAVGAVVGAAAGVTTGIITVSNECLMQ